MKLELKQSIGRWDSLAISLGVVIGVGIFRVPAEVASLLPSGNYILLAWLAGGIISFLGALCYAELSTSLPKTGGDYVYLKESYGPKVAFLYGWTELLIIRPGSIAALSFVFAEFCQHFLGLNSELSKPIAIGIVVILSTLNCISFNSSKNAQTVFMVAKIVALIGIIFSGFFFGNGNTLHFSFVSVKPDIPISLSTFGLALIPILWTFGGWHENTFVAGETKNAKRFLPFALILGTILITALYLIINCVYLYIFPVSTIMESKLVASDVMRAVFGAGGSQILDALAIVFSLGCINAMIITGSRVTFAMGQDHHLFRKLEEVSPVLETPVKAIAFNAIIAIAMIFVGSFYQLLFFTGAVVWLFFSLVMGSLFILRKKNPRRRRPFEVWGYPFVPLAYLSICVGLFLNTVLYAPNEAIVGLGMTLTGYPVYLLSGYLKRRQADLGLKSLEKNVVLARPAQTTRPGV